MIRIIIHDTAIHSLFRRVRRARVRVLVDAVVAVDEIDDASPVMIAYFDTVYSTP